MVIGTLSVTTNKSIWAKHSPVSPRMSLHSPYSGVFLDTQIENDGQRKYEGRRSATRMPPLVQKHTLTPEMISISTGSSLIVNPIRQFIYRERLYVAEQLCCLAWVFNKGTVSSQRAITYRNYSRNRGITGDRNQAASRNSRGVKPVQRLNAREKAACEEKPSR